MRIGIVTDCYPPHMGGIETQTYNLAQQLKSFGYSPEVITATRDGSFVGRRLEGKIPVHRLGMPTLGFTPMNPFAGRLFPAIFPHFDLLHIHVGVLSPFAHLALQIAKTQDIPTLVTFHCELATWAPLMRASGFFNRWVDAGILFSGVSSLMESQINQLLSPSRRRQWPIIPNGIDTEFWAPPKDKLEVKHSSFALGNQVESSATNQTIRQSEGKNAGKASFEAVSAIRLMPRKRPLALMKFTSAVNQILGQAGELRLNIFGEGALEPFLKRRSEVSKGQVRLPGRKDQVGLLKAYRQADFFITLCRNDSFGIAAAEARASGLPLVTLQQSPVRDLINEGITGISAENDYTLAEKTAAALLEGRFLKMRQNCVNQPSPVSWERSLQATIAAYQQAQERRKSSTRP